MVFENFSWFFADYCQQNKNNMNNTIEKTTILSVELKKLGSYVS